MVNQILDWALNANQKGRKEKALVTGSPRPCTGRTAHHFEIFVVADSFSKPLNGSRMWRRKSGLMGCSNTGVLEVGARDGARWEEHIDGEGDS